MIITLDSTKIGKQLSTANLSYIKKSINMSKKQAAGILPLDFIIGFLAFGGFKVHFDIKV